MDRRRRQQRGHGRAALALRAVGQDQDVVILQHGLGRGPAHFLDRQRNTLGAGRCVPGDVDGGAAERPVQRFLHRADLGQILVGEDRLVDFQPLVRARIMAEQIGARADHAGEAHHQFFRGSDRSADW